MVAYNATMKQSYKSWTIYSVGIFIVWAAIFLIRWKTKSNPNLKDLSLLFYGYFLGWLSATIEFVLVSNNIYGPLSGKRHR